MSNPLLNLEFLSNLYGPYFYRIPDTQRPAIKFFNKPEGKITFFIRESEMSRKDLTDMLKKIVDAMKLPHAQVNFGRIERPAAEADFRKMNTDYGIIFDLSYFPLADNFEGKPELKGLHTIACLADIHDHEAVKRKAWQILKKIADEINQI